MGGSIMSSDNSVKGLFSGFIEAVRDAFKYDDLDPRTYSKEELLAGLDHVVESDLLGLDWEASVLEIYDQEFGKKFWYANIDDISEEQILDFLDKVVEHQRALFDIDELDDFSSVLLLHNIDAAIEGRSEEYVYDKAEAFIGRLGINSENTIEALPQDRYEYDPNAPRGNSFIEDEYDF